jgi:hypothetical protein
VSAGGCGKKRGTGISVDDVGVCFCSRAEVGDWLNDESLECEGLIWPSAPLLLSLDDSVKSEDSRFAMMVFLSCYLFFFEVSSHSNPNGGDAQFSFTQSSCSSYP